jgi:tetratricopeptide (TPR) repeat protein
MAFLPFLDVLRSYFAIEEGERDFVMKKKMAEKVTQLDEKLKEILPPLQDILSLKVEDEDYLKLDPALKRVRIFEGIRDLLVRESQNKPLVLAIEDLHWIDNSSEEFLDYLIGGLARAHILQLILYRPEYTHQWGSKTYYTQIRVDELSPETSAEMVQAILQEGKAEQDLTELILGRAAGNPLFMEEFTHSLIERGYIERKNGHYVLTIMPSEIQIPETIQGIIAARMDRLEENLKRTMQVASVIGRDFAYRILHTITGMQEELKSRLVNLQELEFIYEKSLFPELEYIFKHALTQEVAYNSLLLKRRKEIHERIGKAIEELYPDRLAEFYEMLAYHYASGESWEKAYQYLKLSGDKTLRTRSRWETFRFYREALQALRKLPEIKENKRRKIDVGLSLMAPMHSLFFPEDSLEILLEGERLSRELGDDRSLSRFHGGLGAYYAFTDSRRARAYLEDAFREAENAQDLDLMAPLGFQICTMYFIRGDFLKLADVAPRVIALLESTQRESHFFGVSTMPYPYLVSLYGFALASLGNFSEGRAQCEKGLRFSTKINDMGSIGWAECLYSFLFAFQGDGKGAIEHAQQAIKYAEQLQMFTLLSVACCSSAFGCIYMGDYENALKYSEKGQQIWRDAGMSLPSIWLAYVCMIYIESGDLANARSYAEKALESAQKEQEKWAEGLASVCVGRILGMQDNSRWAEAEGCILRGIQTLDEHKLRPFYAIGYLYLGELYAHTGQREKALENLQEAEAMCQDMSMEYYLRRTQSALEKLEARK